MSGVIEVKQYKSAADMTAAHAATRARLMNPANAYQEPAPTVELEAPKPKPVLRHWPVQLDSHVTAWKLATYKAKVKSLEMSLRNSVETINRMVGEFEKTVSPRISALDVCKSVLLDCAANGEGNYSVLEITGPRRDKHLIKARHKCVAEVVVNCPHLNYSDIGKFFNRDHSTIIHAARKMGVLRPK